MKPRNGTEGNALLWKGLGMRRSANRPLGRRQQRVRTLSRQVWRVWATITGFLLVVWGGVGWIEISRERKATASDNLPEIALVAGTDFACDLQQLQPGQTRFFTYPTGSSERSRLLVARDSGGLIRAAFAPCTMCYSDRRKHRLRKGKLVCGKCQTVMRIGDQSEKVNAAKGCVAVPIPFSIENNKVTVRTRSIMEGIKTFVNSKIGAVQGGAN